MKLFRLTLLLLTALLLNGCIDEDLSSCPNFRDKSLWVDFVYTNKGGVDIFADNIVSVDLFVYDANGVFVTQQYVSQKDLLAYSGTELALLPGTYRIVCWGNAAEKTYLYQPLKGSMFRHGYLDFAVGQTRAATMLGGDPLYYAPSMDNAASAQQFTVTVPKEGEKKATINFRTAHSIVEVYVKGFTDKNKDGEPVLPQIELQGIPTGYNFGLQGFGPPVTYSGVTTHETVDGEQLAVIRFITPLFWEERPIDVVVKKQSDNSPLTIFSLTNFIRDNSIDASQSIKLTIPIMIEYKDVEVEVRLPSWYRVPVEPEI